jgi:hypothetical protein
MRWLGLLLAFVSIGAFIADIYYVTVYLHLSSFSWDVIFRTEPLHHYFMMAFGDLVFAIMPGMAGICGLSAWMILRHLDNISNEGRAA